MVSLDVNTEMVWGEFWGRAGVVARLRTLVELYGSADSSLPHSLVLWGGAGTGRMRAARQFMYELGGVPISVHDECGVGGVGGFHELGMDAAMLCAGNSIGIKAVREMREFAQMRGRGGVRVVVVSDASVLSSAAQHALLKVIEEPASRVVVVFVSSYRRQLLATVRSRSLMVEIESLRRSEVVKIFGDVGELPEYYGGAVEKYRAFDGVVGQQLRDRAFLDDPMIVHAVRARDVFLRAIGGELKIYECLSFADSVDSFDVAVVWLDVWERLIADLAIVKSGGTARWFLSCADDLRAYEGGFDDIVRWRDIVKDFHAGLRVSGVKYRRLVDSALLSFAV